ncbi:hypothetical protein ADUPG1_006822 [Aduncisulcus paluster]|uniref:Myb-like domain-containing protein n=1 Tax=Aduncisulcus paluster TaxID=2918883 RepID=A0ABQ5KN71_9EUKA|nr:hypothetical protein ADUPG1_006822 [Aduncisulcus paluster]
MSTLFSFSGNDWKETQISTLKKLVLTQRSSSSHGRVNWIQIGKIVGKSASHCRFMFNLLHPPSVKHQPPPEFVVFPKSYVTPNPKIYGREIVNQPRTHLAWTDEEVFQSVFLYSRLENKWKSYSAYASLLSRRATQIKCKIFNLRSKNSLDFSLEKVKDIITKAGLSWKLCSIKQGLIALGVNYNSPKVVPPPIPKRHRAVYDYESWHEKSEPKPTEISHSVKLDPESHKSDEKNDVLLDEEKDSPTDQHESAISDPHESCAISPHVTASPSPYSSQPISGIDSLGGSILSVEARGSLKQSRVKLTEEKEEIASSSIFHSSHESLSWEDSFDTFFPRLTIERVVDELL